MRQVVFCLVALAVTGCAPLDQGEEDLVLAEPVVVEQAPATGLAKSLEDCENLGDDGIGGTGCPAAP